MLAVGGSLGEFGAHNGYYRRERVAEIVDSVHHDGYGASHESYSGLEGRQQHIGNYANSADLNNLLVSIHTWKKRFSCRYIASVW